jgi:type VI protein secretion system component VasK
MAEEPRLKVVAERDPTQAAAPAEPTRPQRGFLIALAVALAITLVLLLWSRNQMGAEIAGLEGQISELQAAVQERDRVIDAHERRLEDVRVRVDELVELIESPLTPRR